MRSVPIRRETLVVMKLMSATAMLVLVAVAAGSTVPLRAESPSTLTVRLYNTAGLPVSALVAARLAAGPILRDTGIDVTFRTCQTADAARADAPIDRCDDSLKPGEVVVRIVDAPALNPVLDPTAYGVTYVVRETNRGWLATVFADRITAAASRVDLDRGTLIGRVLAHEVGHLLLGSGYHGDAGLMRAQWPDDLLQHRDAAEWRFSMTEVAAIHDVLRR